MCQFCEMSVEDKVAIIVEASKLAKAAEKLMPNHEQAARFTMDSIDLLYAQDDDRAFMVFSLVNLFLKSPLPGVENLTAEIPQIAEMIWAVGLRNLAHLIPQD